MDTQQEANVGHRVPKPSVMARSLHPNSWMGQRLSAGLPQPFRHSFTRFSQSLLEKPKLDPDLDRALRERFAEDIQQLGQMLDRDLSGWLNKA